MRDRRALTAITLLVLTGLLVVGAVMGVRALFAPLPGGDDEGDDTAALGCNTDIRAGDRVRSNEVAVSVYNAGNQGGLAERTRDQLEQRGFIGGAVGNAPSGLEVDTVRVLAPSKKDPAARLVARQFGGKPAKLIQVTETRYGPGVDVVVGSDFTGLVKAGRGMKAKVDGTGC